jgi:hypothetical protein
MTKARYRSVVGLAGLLAAAGALSACGAASNPATGNAAGGRSTVTGGAQTSQLGIEAMYSFIPATGAQYTTGSRFTGLEQSLESIGVARCMRRYGFHTVTPEPVSVAEANDSDDIDFPDLARIDQTKSFGGSLLKPGEGGAPPAPGSMSAAQTQAYGADENRCAQIAEKIFFLPLTEGGALEGLWQQDISQAESAPAVEATLGPFWACSQQAGIPAQPDPEHPLAPDAPSDAYFHAFMGWMDALASRATTQAALAAIDAHWAPVFVQCATPVVQALDKILVPKQSAFLQAHYQQVHALEQLAGQAMDNAERAYDSTGSG